MELTLNRAALGVETSGIRRFTALTRATPGACSLTIGEPDLDSPGSVREAAKAALDAGDTHYPPGNGYPYLLEALSQYEETSHSLHYSPDEIIVTVGATEGPPRPTIFRSLPRSWRLQSRRKPRPWSSRPPTIPPAVSTRRKRWTRSMKFSGISLFLFCATTYTGSLFTQRTTAVSPALQTCGTG